MILDLKEEENHLILNMSKYHRKNINKTSKIKNIKFEALNKKKVRKVLLKSLLSLKSIIEFLLEELQGQKKTWDIMLKKSMKMRLTCFV